MALLSIGLILLISIEGYSKYKIGVISPEKQFSSQSYNQTLYDSFWVSYGETESIGFEPYSLSEFISRFLFVIAVSEPGRDRGKKYMPKGHGLAYDLTRKIHFKQQLKMDNWHLDSAILSSWVSRNYRAEEALNLMFQWQYFGIKVAGLDQAAIHYFETHWSNLSLNQIITLIVFSQAPSRYTDCNNKEKLIVRAQEISDRLKQFNPAKYGSFQFSFAQFIAKDGITCT